MEEENKEGGDFWLIEETMDFLNCDRKTAIFILIVGSPIILPILLIVAIFQLPLIILVIMEMLFGKRD